MDLHEYEIRRDMMFRLIERVTATMDLMRSLVLAQEYQIIAGELRYVTSQLEALAAMGKRLAKENADFAFNCTQPPDGWWCSIPAGHTGPCAARRNGDSGRND